MKPFGIVYLIWNMVNGKKYVGQTIQPLEKRFNAHKYADSLLGRAIRKYGAENFRYGVIKLVRQKPNLMLTKNTLSRFCPAKHPTAIT